MSGLGETQEKGNDGKVVAGACWSLEKLAVVIRPEMILVEMKRILFQYLQYAHDDSVEIFVYNGLPKPERICDDEHLRNILKVCKLKSKSKLTISLESPSKNFSAWNFKDVCTEYNLSSSSDPDLIVIPPFMGIEPTPWYTDL
ncbi:hypothetical protein BGZ80_003480 [Entomortierella chlamydospora]|uniref:Uncharacterized protein n=1 Tax=Entomortierella chlamydospora TaxID=101097 RepID=A0A9P6MN60_9FUNG|nr:hypothetical protein BGZ79_005570 [Entomortierella chlamydospora]KAG0008416.1 hypothetical protein BGZ80_003480 [Entomortierella chlamydospora]